MVTRSRVELGKRNAVETCDMRQFHSCFEFYQTFTSVTLICGNKERKFFYFFGGKSITSRTKKDRQMDTWNGEVWQRKDDKSLNGEAGIDLENTYLRADLNGKLYWRLMRHLA